MQKAIILLSGGLDSLTCLAVARSQGKEIVALTFDYGQRGAEYEVTISKKICEHYGCEHVAFNLPCEPFMMARQLNTERRQQGSDDDRVDTPIDYVPARNIIFLCFAAAYAESLDIPAIYIGSSVIDYSGYPDSRPEFFEAFQHMLALGTRLGRKGKAVSIQTPLLHLSRSDIIRLGTTLKVDYSMSVSCYAADDQGRACGTCTVCVQRSKSFQAAGVPDPTPYIETAEVMT